ncbi:MAG: hypothetical protein KGZ94_04075 [Clostridia bacterium]|nr:hypothetical protein [Clostridia bacterium]
MPHKKILMLYGNAGISAFLKLLLGNGFSFVLFLIILFSYPIGNKLKRKTIFGGQNGGQNIVYAFWQHALWE